MSYQITSNFHANLKNCSFRNLVLSLTVLEEKTTAMI